MDSYSVLYSSAHRTGLLSGFQRLRSLRKMCDVVLQVEDVSFPCHRALLASSSDYFWALFGENTAESKASTICLRAVTPQGLDAILDFLYSGWLSLSPCTVADTVEAARYLQVEAAVSICEQYMIDCLNSENCCYYANLAERHALVDALEVANQTIAMEMRQLLREHKEDLLNLNMQSLLAVFDADEIPAVKEVELVQLALDWLEANGPFPLLKSNLLLSRLRFGLVTASDLTSLSNDHSAMASPLIRSQVTRALEYHRLGSAKPINQNKQSTLRASPNRVLLVGDGFSHDSLEQQLLMFDPRNRKFTPLGCNLPLPLRNFCVCSVGGFLFVLGGEEVKNGDEESKKSPNVATSSQVWRYDPRLNSWEQVESMLDRRAQFTCCVVEDFIYAVGGRYTNPVTAEPASVASVEFYDMATGKWRKGPTMPRPLYGHAVAVLENRVYVSGGVSHNVWNIGGNNRSEPTEGSREFICLGLDDRAWEKRASMSIARFFHRSAAARGFVYSLLGKYEPFCDIERYDPGSDHWTRLKPLLTGSFNYGMVSTVSGNLLLFGGRRWSDGQEVTVKSVLEYDTKKDQWKEICQLPRPLTGIECTLLPLPD